MVSKAVEEGKESDRLSIRVNHRSFLRVRTSPWLDYTTYILLEFSYVSVSFLLRDQ